MRAAPSGTAVPIASYVSTTIALLVAWGIVTLLLLAIVRPRRIALGCALFVLE